MVVAQRLRRGEVWLICLDPTVGAEIKKTRPCLIVSPPEINDHLRTALVAPLTSKGFAAPFRLPVAFGGTSGLVLLDQLRAVDKARLVKRLGEIDEAALTATLDALREAFTL